MGIPELTAAETVGTSTLAPRWQRVARPFGAVSGWTLRVALTAMVAATLGLMAWSLIPLALGWHGRVVLSGSMQPAIDPGDVVVVVPVDPSTLRPGQAVAFRDPARPERVDIHRVVGRRGDGAFITKGDANAQTDSTPVPASDVLGLPRLRVPWVGLPQYWWQQREYAKIGVAVLVLTAAIWVVVAGPSRRRAAAAARGGRRAERGKHRQDG